MERNEAETIVDDLLNFELHDATRCGCVSNEAIAKQFKVPIKRVEMWRRKQDLPRYISEKYGVMAWLSKQPHSC